MAIGTILAILGFAMGSIYFLEPLQRDINYWVNSLRPNRLPSETELIEMLFRGFIDEDQYKDLMKKLGYDEERAIKLFEIRKSLLTAEQLTLAYWRNIIDQNEYKEGMKKLGYDDKMIEKFEQIHRFYPSADDFIRFAVRDVYNEQIVQKYGYDEEFPENIVDDVAKVGMDEKWIRYFWRAHWDLPSPTQGYEMLHRLNPDVIKVLGEKYKDMGLNPNEIETDLDTLRELLKIADYPKYWRDRLIAIAYSPLTRVDLRRIYFMGLIDDEECIARLMELGYTKKDAELLLNWFKIEKAKADMDKVKAKLDDLYKAGKITKEELKEYYKSMGYSDLEIELIITYIDYEIKEEYKKEQLKLIERQFKKGIIDEGKAREQLNRLGVLNERIDYYINLWKTQIKSSEKHLTKSDVEKLVKFGIISIDEAKNLLQSIGYSEKAIDYLIRLWKKEFSIT